MSSREKEKRERQEIRYLVRESKDTKNIQVVVQVTIYFKTRDKHLRGLAPAWSERVGERSQAVERANHVGEAKDTKKTHVCLQGTWEINEGA